MNGNAPFFSCHGSTFSEKVNGNAPFYGCEPLAHSGFT